MATSRKSESQPDLFGSSSEEPPVSPSRSQEKERDWMIRVATSPLNLSALPADFGPHGWYGRTSPEFYQSTKEAPSRDSWERWKNAGMGGHTGCLTLSISEYPSAGAACSLSDILETSALPLRYFLSAKACQGIIRRADRRGKSLPFSLQAALEQAAQGTSEKRQT